VCFIAFHAVPRRADATPATHMRNGAHAGLRDDQSASRCIPRNQSQRRIPAHLCRRHAARDLRTAARHRAGWSFRRAFSGPVIDRDAAALLGSHVRRRAHHRTGRGHVPRRRGVTRQLGDPEVEELDPLAARASHDTGRCSPPSSQADSTAAIRHNKHRGRGITIDHVLWGRSHMSQNAAPMRARARDHASARASISEAIAP
jgi:hypothetical protein